MLTFLSHPLASTHRSGYLRDQTAVLLSRAGIRLNGPEPWDPQIRDERFFARVLAEGSLGLGESYMLGWWECERIDELVARAVRAGLNHDLAHSWRECGLRLRAWLLNLQSPRRAAEVAVRHYDLGNDLFRRMLDAQMIYSCAYWREATTLDAAQEAKLDLICRKLGILPGMRVLDIGCGWGGLARFMAERCGAHVVGLTISTEQAEAARQHCAGLPVQIRLQDYREEHERFDRIVSVGMFEHVGVKNYGQYMRVARRCLNEDGLFLLHTIGADRSTTTGDPWLERYIFPNGMIPSATQIAAAAEDHFVLEDWHNLGPDYDRTLLAWERNFEAAWPQLQERYGSHFRRMWRYYLLFCAGLFRARRTHVWQIVYSPNGLAGGYSAVR